MDSTGSSSNNEEQNFDQEKHLEEIRQQVNQEFQPESDKALEDLKKAAAAIVKRPISEHLQLGFIRDAADDLNLRNQPDDALRELLDEARQALTADTAHDIDGADQFTVRRVQDVMPGFIKQGMFHMLNAEQGAGKSCFCLGLFRALVSDEQSASFLNVEVDSSTNWRLFLIAPDMPKESWALPLANYGFATLTSQVEGELETYRLDPRIAKLRTMETGYSLSPRHIEMYREWALEAQAKGERALFVFDSYSSLVANYTQIDEVKASFAQPLQNLQKGLADTGATTVVLHHTAKSGSSSTASSGTGTNRLGRIPDVVISMEALNKNSDRMLLTSSKRVQSTCLLVQQDFEAGQWICHGDGRKAQRERELFIKVANLKGPQEKIYEWAQQRWENQGKPFSCEDVRHLIERSVQTARNHVRKMEADGLIFHCDDEPTVTKPMRLYLPAEYRDDWQKGKDLKPIKNPVKSGESIAAQENSQKNRSERTHATLETKVSDPSRSFVIPCHPLQTQVTYEGKTWTVTEANLANGEHTITRGAGITRKGLRMLDLEIVLDLDEEL